MGRSIFLALVAATVAWVTAVRPATAQEPSPHGDLEAACEDCHTAEGWTPLRSSLAFDHGNTGFALVGAHGGAGCADCHRSLEFTRIAAACADCHRDPHRGELGLLCETCHTPHDWDNRERLFELHGATLFPLLGTHAITDCESCHRDQHPFEFAATPTECVGCHREDYLGAEEPDHVAAGFPTECTLCHAALATAWTTAAFDHDASFPLVGAHRRVECSGCHASGFAGTPTDCASCHRADYDATREPSHAGAGFPLDCTICHSSESWETAEFDHGATRFPLTGAHRDGQCSSCHSRVFRGTTTECFGCHEADYRGTATPDHEAAGFPRACEQCHGTSSWATEEFDHDGTGFVLTGAHRDAECSSCHAQGYAGTPSECDSCHRSDYLDTDDPDHEAAGFPTECEQCHRTDNWSTRGFDHASTGFLLTGAHRDTACSSCHASGYAGTASECYSCHRSDYEGTRSPNHVAAGYPRECEECHRTSSWATDAFDHDTTGFLLTGAHRDAQCSSCHASGYAGTPTECYACHRSDYEGADDPDHAGFQTTCQDCHGTGGWSGARFDHGSTGFALTGAHRDAQCSSCHATGYAGTPAECYACHRSDYEGADDPDHAGFQTTCQDCHSTSGWSGADFDHAVATGFALVGAHRDAQCSSCHATGYAGTPTDCYSCHRAEYDGTTDPGHLAAGFPTSCQDCHGQDQWEGATFDHDVFFPIDSGPHREAWSSCRDCHVSSASYAVFECIVCHEHSNSGELASKHHEVPGYVFESNACYNCHRNGRS